MAWPTAANAAKPSPPPRLDTATVSGDHFVVDDFALYDIRIDAFSGPSGENAGGSASFGVIVQPGLSASGSVGCLKVTGNTAIIRMEPGLFGFPTILRLVDNGGGGADTLQYYPLFPEFGEDLNCETGAPGYFGGRVDGRVQIIDAPPLPTSKDQCRNGAWSALGFTNQGLCIKAVPRG